MSRAPPKPSPNDGSSSKNEYIPAFISKKPFYVEDSTLSDADYLEHQRLQSLPQDTLATSKWYDRGRKLGPAATKFRKGACENCGAMTHKTKECLSRPRKHGAKWTGRDIQADEVVEDVNLGWDAKRDRWNGYDAREYSAVVREYEELEALKKATAGTAGQKQIETGEDEEHTNDPEIESAKYAEETDMGRNQPTSTRNLRIREDTAKYLLNLDLESAKYDPKTRSMADAGVSTDKNDDSASALLADENFMRSSGDAAEFEKAQRYAWETQEKGPVGGKKLHLQANPTEGEILRKKQTEAAGQKREASKKALLDKYGGSEHLQSAPFRAAENERYVEYDESGGVKGEVRRIARSKYREDVWLNNHTSVWGSWWSNFQWGYACCHSLVKNSYCTGEEGKTAFEEAERLKGGDLLLLEEGQDEPQPLVHQGEEGANAAEKPEEPGVQPQPKTTTAKKRTLQEMRQDVTDEEMEAFKRNRAAVDDPMAKFLGKDELVH
jgi:pre-mRNA-processing factor SLU7